MDPIVNPSFPEPQIYPSTTVAQYAGPGVQSKRGPCESARRDNNSATSLPRRQYRRRPGYHQDANPENRLNATEGARERNPAASEVRFTIPRLESTRQTARAPPAPPSREPPIHGTSNTNIQQKNQEQELQEAIDKLERLKSNRDEAKRSKSHILMADLVYYAIPDLESRIETLKQDLEKKAPIKTLKQDLPRDERDSKGAPDEKQSQAPHTVVETDSEGSEGPESKAQDFNDSDNGSAALDLYDES